MTSVYRLAGIIRKRPPPQRQYSFFSSKGKGNGSRFFTGNSNKVPAAKGTTTNTTTPKDASTKATDGSLLEGGVSGSATTVAPVAPTVEPIPPSPVHHPELTTRHLGLHNFFSLHRPLLLLSEPTSSIFHSPSLSTQPSEEEDPEHESSESAAALLLSYSLITSTLAPRISFEAALARLGSKEAVEMQDVVDKELEKGRVLMDSVKRKKRRKMSKHKLKKRKRALRELQRRTGK